MLLRRLSSFSLAVVLAAGLAAHAAPTGVSADWHTLRTVRAMDAARKQGPPALQAFLAQMPKGADLHVHLSGAVYAESWLRAAGQDGLCIDTRELRFAAPGPDGHCADGQVAAAQMLATMQQPASQSLYDKLIDSFSMRSFVPSAGWSGHDHFFATFSRFSGTRKSHAGEWIDEVASRAAAQNEQYLELMDTPGFSHAAQLAAKIGWDADLPALRQRLIDGGLFQEVAPAQAAVEDALHRRDQIEHCHTDRAQSGCTVTVRFLYQILRDFPPEQVFAQTLLGFETISRVPEFVGINFVQPEDAYYSMRDYTRQMQMLDYLHRLYPKVHITLHAGELAPGLVPPDGLRFHIRQAIELGHAERIGHGVDVMHEDNAQALLKVMATHHIMVEINLTSNDVILGIRGRNHPLPQYLHAGVPVALSTDDEGVSRIDLTHEYLRAADEFNLGYLQLKQMARTSLEHDFLPGNSLWLHADRFSATVPACARQPLGAEKPSPACRSYLDANPHAAQQWELERRFRVFEAQW